MPQRPHPLTTDLDAIANRDLFEMLRPQGEEFIPSPEFASPSFDDTDSPNTPSSTPSSSSSSSSSSSAHCQTSPALFDYGDTQSGGVLLFGPNPIVTNSNRTHGTPNIDSLHLQSGGLEDLDSLLARDGSPISPTTDTRYLISPTTPDAHSAHPEGVRSVSDPLAPKQLLDAEAPTQQRNYGPSAASRQAIPTEFQERRANILDRRRRGLGVGGEVLSEDAILKAAIEGKRRAD